MSDLKNTRLSQTAEVYKDDRGYYAVLHDNNYERVVKNHYIPGNNGRLTWNEICDKLMAMGFPMSHKSMIEWDPHLVFFEVRVIEK